MSKKKTMATVRAERIAKRREHVRSAYFEADSDDDRPTIAELAQALNVGAITIRKDIAALIKESPELADIAEPVRHREPKSRGYVPEDDVPLYDGYKALAGACVVAAVRELQYRPDQIHANRTYLPHEDNLRFLASERAGLFMDAIGVNPDVLCREWIPRLLARAAESSGQ